MINDIMLTVFIMGLAVLLWPVTLAVTLWLVFAMVVTAYKEAKYNEKKARRETGE